MNDAMQCTQLAMHTSPLQSITRLAVCTSSRVML